jgi:hypothetical protein
MVGSGGSPALGQPFAPEGLAFSFGRAPPDPGALIGFEGVLEAVLDDGTDRTNGHGFLDVGVLGVVRGGEEEGVGITGAGGAGPPVRNQLGREVRWPVGHTYMFAVPPGAGKTRSGLVAAPEELV